MCFLSGDGSRQLLVCCVALPEGSRRLFVDALGGATGAGGLLSKEAREVSVVILGSRLLARFESGKFLSERRIL